MSDCYQSLSEGIVGVHEAGLSLDGGGRGVTTATINRRSRINRVSTEPLNNKYFTYGVRAREVPNSILVSGCNIWQKTLRYPPLSQPPRLIFICYF